MQTTDNNPKTAESFQASERVSPDGFLAIKEPIYNFVSELKADIKNHVPFDELFNSVFLGK